MSRYLTCFVGDDCELPEIVQTALFRSALAAVPHTTNISTVFLTAVEVEDGYTAPFHHRAAAYRSPAVLDLWWRKKFQQASVAWKKVIHVVAVISKSQVGFHKGLERALILKCTRFILFH